MSSRAACCLLPAAVAWRVSKADYNTDAAFTLHYYERRMKDAEQWSTGQMVRWSTGQLVCLAEPLNYVTLGKFINFLCRANRFAVISLSLSICIDYCRSARWHVRGVANLHGNRHASEGRERDPESGGVMQNISQLVNKCAWTEVNECHLINVSSPKRQTT